MLVTTLTRSLVLLEAPSSCYALVWAYQPSLAPAISVGFFPLQTTISRSLNRCSRALR